MSIFQCRGWTIETVEGIGNKKKGYHPLQKILADYNGTQCGFCTPGWVMSMYTLYEKGDFTMQEVEDHFGSNLCRCTGYRSILSAFKSLARDSDNKTIPETTCFDIEDFQKCTISEDSCRNRCKVPCASKSTPGLVTQSKSTWYKVHNLNEIFDVLRDHPNETYMLVAGNTAKGM